MFVPQVPLLKGLSRPSEKRSELLFYKCILKNAGAAGYEPSIFKTWWDSNLYIFAKK